MGAKVPLTVAQANEANNATDETPAKVVLLRALRLACFLASMSTSKPMTSFAGEDDEQGVAAVRALTGTSRQSCQVC